MQQFRRLCHLYSTNPDRILYLQHFYCPCLVNTPYLLPIYMQNTISHIYVQSVHHLSSPCPISTPSLLPITSENPTLYAHVISIHLSSPCSVRMPLKVVSAHVQSKYHLSYPCTHVLSVHHLFCPCPISHHISFPCPVSSSPLQNHSWHLSRSRLIAIF